MVRYKVFEFIKIRMEWVKKANSQGFCLTEEELLYSMRKGNLFIYLFLPVVVEKKLSELLTLKLGGGNLVKIM